MAEIIFLSDTCHNDDLTNMCGRYMGPYPLATQLQKAGFDAVVLDHFTKLDNFFEYFRNLLTPNTLFVGVSSTFLAPSSEKFLRHVVNIEDNYYNDYLWLDNEESMLQWTGQLRLLMNEICPQAKLILGGGKAFINAFKPNEMNRAYRDFDYFIMGASDYCVVDFAQKLKNEETIDYQEYKGIKVIQNHQNQELNICPESVFSFRDAIQPGEGLPIEVARGCKFNCKFCRYDKKISIRKPLDILRNEMIRNFELFGTDTYTFCDDCFNDSRKKVEEVCQMMIDLPFKINWSDYARFDVAVKFPETVDLMIKSGVRGLHIGAESFNFEVARRAGKGTNTEKIKDFLNDFVQKYNDQCKIKLSFIIGLPGETIKSQRETFLWAQENPDVQCGFNVLGIFPYIHSIDKKVIDFADYARNPKKYGFTRIEFDPQYWEHETMTSDEANDLMLEFVELSEKNGLRGIYNSIFQIPFLRALGYEWKDLNRLWKTPKEDPEANIDLEFRYQNYLNNYFRDFSNANFVQKSHSKLEVPVL